MEVELKRIEGWKTTLKGGKLLVDFTLKSYGHGPDMPFTRMEKIVTIPKSEIRSMGYRRCEGLKSHLAFYGMPVYVRFHNFRKCDFRFGHLDMWGEPTNDPNGWP